MSETPTSRRAYRAASAGKGAEVANVHKKAGRDLPAAIAVGCGLGAIVLVSLLTWKPIFVAVVTIGVSLGVWELIQALRSGRIAAPLVPTMLAAAALAPAAYLAGPEGLSVAFALSCVVIVVWVAVESGRERANAIRDIAGGVFITAYVPLMGGLAALLVAERDGVSRIIVFIVVTISSDIGGYAFGATFGRHPMAPMLSPKKSWEGFAGSVLSCVLVGVVSVVLLLDGAWWIGVILGVAVACFATMGDLAESTLKRDLGIKDMGTLLPGHGGLMDRLDSLVMTIPVTFAVLTIFIAI